VGRSQSHNAIRDIILDHYPLAMQGLGGPNCDPATGTRGQGSCYYYNPLMSSALPDAAAQGLANDPELLEWLIPNRIDKFTMDLRTVDARFTGEFGGLRGGAIGLAACRLDDGRRSWGNTEDPEVRAAMVSEEFCGRRARPAETGALTF